ncbi:hypothetical protein FVE85_2152 [Porphyridium purpureum]|uniref:Zinc finger PHD-type domain-containing protein n=1 Tax=Porphyridium purpureum TaxID=35688 RepID=A0A5J4YZW6_PORPP|nr:hypothetical protein FVE85_2152 [Porphyridium purpureum]|eukprot:POR7195..scf209_3
MLDRMMGEGVAELVEGVVRTASDSAAAAVSESPHIDATRAFHICLYILAIEAFLFFAVISQTKSQEPGAHGGIAHSFGLLFLFQSLGALFLVLGSQFYQKVTISLYLSLVSSAAFVFTAVLCIPAAASICVPEARRRSWKTVAALVFLAFVVCDAFFLSPKLKAGIEIPFIPISVRKQILGSIVGGISSILLSCLIRMLRSLKGRNGALVLFVGTLLVTAGGIVWAHMEPLCDASTIKPWPSSCPMPRTFDHNVLMGVIILFGNILATEGILRLMAAGAGTEGYVYIKDAARTSIRGLLELRNDMLHGTDDEYKCAICGLKSPSCIIACDSAGCAARMHLSCAPSGNQHVQKNGTLSVVCPRHSGSTDTSCPLLLTPEHSRQNQSFSGSEDAANRVSDIDLPTTHGVRLPTAGHRAGKGQRQTRRMNKGAQHSRSAVRTGAHKDEKAQHSALATDMELLRKAASTASTGVSAVLIDRPELDVLLSLPASFLCDPQLNWTVLFSQTLRTGYMRKRREMSWGKV